jgi:formyltetrahydrofolate deformylase
MSAAHHVLTVSCPDTTGIVAAVASFFAARRINIEEAAYYADHASKRFFMRTAFDGGIEWTPALADAFAATVGNQYAMDWQVHDAQRRPRLLILVSKFDHCLNDLLYRHRTGTLRAEIVAIASNHNDLAPLAKAHSIPFHHLPVSAASRAAQEAKIVDLVRAANVDLTVLARYMQILSPALVRELAGHAINIHHSFLPSFRGAKPYQQAHARGVKLIGATAHYVSEDLDEGPIVEQEVQRVDHTHTVDDLVALGRDVETMVLARAVRFHIEHRVLLNGRKTVVFR